MRTGDAPATAGQRLSQLVSLLQKHTWLSESLRDEVVVRKVEDDDNDDDDEDLVFGLEVQQVRKADAQWGPTKGLWHRTK